MDTSNSFRDLSLDSLDGFDAFFILNNMSYLSPSLKVFLQLNDETLYKLCSTVKDPTKVNSLTYSSIFKDFYKSLLEGMTDHSARVIFRKIFLTDLIDSTTYITKFVENLAVECNKFDDGSFPTMDNIIVTRLLPIMGAFYSVLLKVTTPSVSNYNNMVYNWVDVLIHEIQNATSDNDVVLKLYNLFNIFGFNFAYENYSMDNDNTRICVSYYSKLILKNINNSSISSDVINKLHDVMNGNIDILDIIGDTTKSNIIQSSNDKVVITPNISDDKMVDEYKNISIVGDNILDDKNDTSSIYNALHLLNDNTISSYTNDMLIDYSISESELCCIKEYGGKIAIVKSVNGKTRYLCRYSDNYVSDDTIYLLFKIHTVPNYVIGISLDEFDGGRKIQFFSINKRYKFSVK